jgi:cystathionine gamma-synthase
MEKHSANGLTISEFLKAHPKVEKVYYPGLPSHPQHGIAKQQMSGFGGVVTFLLKADLEGTIRFVDHLEIPRIAPSLGGVESLVEQPAIMSYWKASKEERERAGMTDNLVRLSLGIEDAHDIIADLDMALKQV